MKRRSSHWALEPAKIDLNCDAISYGTRDDVTNGLQVTFDGWHAARNVAFKRDEWRLPEREYHPLAGVAAGAMALSEVFLSFVEITQPCRQENIASIALEAG